eukprot:TRINITY_DN1801_c1_g1_i3.p1 TRINITY_DN1801_c1_g1~~TRINITY_DN1801_c1_g1_i3.p1  ORF type:complete len:353 (-),score=165.89 TRINITY_DN1801_c1_g1_i3:106-1164(-)
MGWNSWNHFGCSINEQLIKETADAIVQTGLGAAGYRYINLDDCWQISRSENGTIIADSQNFPSGIAALADYIHSRGLLFGLYSDAGEKTCQGRPGSLGYEQIDAQTYASWNVDYLKYDNCYNNNIPPKQRYPPMRDALNSTGRPIFYSLCEWGEDDPATWAGDVGNSWRTTGDISDNWNSMLSIIKENDKWWKYAGPGGWNDPDMLEVGNGGMTQTEYRSHFSLWAISKAPLIIGCDVTNISKYSLSILSAKEVIAINQDSLGIQGHIVNQTTNYQVWTGPLTNNTVAMLLFNPSSKSTSITAWWNDLGIDSTKPYYVRDVWQQENIGAFTGSFSTKVDSHDVFMAVLTPVY